MGKVCGNKFVAGVSKLICMCSAPRWDLGVCCRRKVHYPTSPREDSFIGLVSGNPLCRHCAEVVSWFLWAFCSQEDLSNMQVEVMHLGTGERKWSSSEYPMSQSQVCWKMNLNRELPGSLIFYFHSVSWSEGKIGEREKLSCEAKSWDKLCAPSLFHVFRSWADSIIAFTATRLGLQLVANVIQTAVVLLNGEISWISFSRVSHLAGPVVESRPMVGIAFQHRSTRGALLGSPAMCAVLNHTASSLIIDCL